MKGRYGEVSVRNGRCYDTLGESQAAYYRATYVGPPIRWPIGDQVREKMERKVVPIMFVDIKQIRLHDRAEVKESFPMISYSFLCVNRFQSYSNLSSLEILKLISYRFQYDRCSDDSF